MPTVSTLLRGGIFQKIRQGLVSVLNPDQGRSDLLFGLEIIVDQQDAGLACVDVFLVFRVGIEAKLTAFTMLYLRK